MTADTSDTAGTSPVYEPPVIPCAPEQTPFPHCGCLTFATSIGSYFNDTGYALAPTPSGGIALAGEFGGSATFGLGQPNETTLVAVDAGPYNDGFVAVYSSVGELLWVRQHSDSYYSEAVVVAVDAASGRVVAGGHYSNPLTVEGGGVQFVLPNDNNDAYLVSYDSEGTLQWAVHTSSDNHEELTSLAFGSSGELYVTGYSGATRVDVFSTNGSQLRMKDMGTGGLNAETAGFLLRIEADGQLSWAQRMTGAGYQEPERLAVLSDGNLVTAGSFTTELILDPRGLNETILTPSAKLFLARYTADGAFLSAQTAPADSTTDIAGVVATNTGFVFAGETGANTVFAPGTPQETTLSSVSGAFATFSADGTFQAVHTFYDQGTSGLSGIGTAAVAGNTGGNSFAIAGLQKSTVTFAPGEPHEIAVDPDPYNTGEWDPLLLVLDDNGLLDCFWHLDGSAIYDQAYGVAYDNSGGVWVTGQFSDTLRLARDRPDKVVLEPIDDNDIFLARFALRPDAPDTTDTGISGTSTTTPGTTTTSPP